MFKITFIDKTIFKGNIFDSSWNKIPDKNIKQIKYSYENITFIFNGFETYNHIIKKAVGVNISINKILEIRLMGKWQDKVYQIVFDLKRNTVKRLVEKYEDLNFTGWKKGIISSTRPSIAKLNSSSK